MKRDRRLYKRLTFEVYKKSKICEKCQSTDNIHIHHIDKNSENNKENNLMILCRSCHMKLHKLGNKNLLGYKHTKESKIKISLNSSKYWKGKKFTEEHKIKLSKNSYRNKKVSQYDLQGNFIKTFNLISEAYKETKINHISTCCRGKCKTAGGFIWKYFIN